MAFGAPPPIGLDIGTSAVRAAQITKSRGGYALTSFAQVALPADAVTDGEIRDAGAVSEAVAELRKRARLKTKSAVVGVANQRVVVRQVDLPYLEEKDFRSSLRFQVADHIPMPVDDAQLDFQIIDDYITEGQEHMMRVLLAAAATDMVEAFVDVVTAAGLEPGGIDLAPFAVARAVSASARGESGMAGSEAIVDIGAGVTNVVIHNNGEPRFVRILVVGGDDITTALARELNLSFDEAEAAKLDLGRGVGNPDARRVLDDRVGALVEEIRGSLDYYQSQEAGERVSSVVVSGGGSLTPGLMGRLEQTIAMQVRRATPLVDIDVSRSGLTPEQVTQIEPVVATAVGLAMGTAGR